MRRFYTSAPVTVCGSRERSQGARRGLWEEGLATRASCFLSGTTHATLPPQAVRGPTFRVAARGASRCWPSRMHGPMVSSGSQPMTNDSQQPHCFGWRTSASRG